MVLDLGARLSEPLERYFERRENFLVFLVAVHGNIDVLEVFAKYPGGNILTRKSDGDTLLHTTVQGNQETSIITAKYLLSHGIELETCNKVGRTAFR